MQMEQELKLLADADSRAACYLAGGETMRVFPDAASLAGFACCDGACPDAHSNQD